MTDKTSPVYLARQAAQDKLERYRQRAVALYGSTNISLATFSPVQPVDGGAYVDMTVWVPDEDPEVVKK